MKKTYTYFAIISIIFLLAFSSNPPNGRTGAPGESTCAGCHGGNTPIQGSVEIEGLPDRIMGGTPYDITVRAIVTNGNAMRAGFQLVALNENNQNIGMLTQPGSNVGFETFNSRTYAEHRSAKSFGGASELTYEFQWIAPENLESGAVSMYASCVLADGNGSSGGDRVVTTNITSEVEISTSATERDPAISIRVFPNPTADYLQINWEGIQVAQNPIITLTDLNGRIVLQQSGGMGSDQIQIDLRSLQPGIYLTTLNLDGRMATKKVVKL